MRRLNPRVPPSGLGRPLPTALRRLAPSKHCRLVVVMQRSWGPPPSPPPSAPQDSYYCRRSIHACWDLLAFRCPMRRLLHAATC